MKLPPLFIELPCFALIFLGHMLPISTEAYLYLAGASFLVLMFYGEQGVGDGADNVKIHLRRITDTKMSYEITNKSNRSVLIDKVYTANKGRNRVSEIAGCGLPPELLNLPVAFTGLAPKATMTGEFEIDEDAAFFYVQLDNGYMFTKKIKKKKSI